MSTHRHVRLVREIIHVPTGERRRTEYGWLDAMAEDEFSRARRQASAARRVGEMLGALFPEAATAIRQPWPPQAALVKLRAQEAAAVDSTSTTSAELP